MPSFDAPILRVARHVADIKRGGKSIEEKAEAIGKFVTSFSLETRADRRRAAKRSVLPPIARIRAKIAENHGFVLEKERREKGAGVDKVEQAAIAPSPRVMEEAVTMRSLEEVMHKLHTDTILFLHTADTLAAALREYDLDWSPAVIMLCKAFEKETNVRLLLPLRAKTCGRDLKADLSDEDLGRVARFCSAAGQPPELGTLGRFLNTAIHSKRRRASSILLQSFYELMSDWPGSQWLVDEFGLEAALKKLTKEFRNPAAHIEKLSERDFGNCRNFVREAPEIVMLKLFLATSR